MLSVKQSVVVQDYSRTRNNNELKRRQRSGRKQQKNRPKSENADTRFRARNLYRPREEVLRRARQFVKPHEKVSSSREIRHQRFNFVRDKIDFARDKNDFARE